MGRRGGPASLVLIVVVLGLVGIGVAALSWSRESAPGGGRTAMATVVQQATCGRGAGDLVEVRLDGRAERLRLDGCGHLVGQRFRVSVSQDGTRAFRAADEPSGGGMRLRTSLVLLTLAGIAGAGYSLLVFGPR